ncbi:ABC transporter substrate-binding protein [Microbacterium sp. AZCO]|uniref:ABC transporter substrate-binding protein n=1 Tax=Microbacterium sp. AZCO TaxID=3142976 RepID=UPI0031F45063
MRRSSALAVFAGALSLTVLASGCTAGGSGDNTAAQESGKAELVLGMEADLPGWDPAKLLPGSVAWAAQAVYDTILTCDEKGGISAGLAEEWEFSDNNTKLTLQIRDGVEFSDGTALDAAAVKATLDYEFTSPGGQSFFAGVTAEAPDENTVVITTPQPKPFLTSYLCLGTGVVASPTYLASGDLDSEPVGSGPYTYDLANSTPGAEYVFTKNPDNWNADAYPYEKLVLKVLADTTARVNALKTGQISGAVLPPSTLAELQSAGTASIPQQGTWSGLLINDRDGKIVPALGNADVRRAINMVFDKAAIAEKLYQGQAEPTSQIFRAGSDAWIDGLEDPYPYDLTAAKELMEEAGYADGFDMELPYIANFGLDSAMPVVIDGLKELNINVTQVTLAGQTALLDLLSGKYPVIFWPLGNHGDSRITIDGAIVPTAIWNTSHVSDPTVDELWNTILTTQGDESKAAQQELNQYVIDQAWFSPWVYVSTFFMFDDSKVGIDKSSDPNQLAPLLSDFK